jgi:hypothetical protein
MRERGAAEHPERYEQQTRHDGRADEPAVCSSKQFLHPATSRVTVLGFWLPARYGHSLSRRLEPKPHCSREMQAQSKGFVNSL